MNVLKKLKLTLLATSVMFFPKVGHAFDQEKDDPTELTRSIPASSSQPEEITSGAPTAKRDISDVSLLSIVYGPEKLVQLLSNVLNFSTSITDKEDLRKIREVHEETSSEEFDARVAALKKFTSSPVLVSNTDSSVAERVCHFLNLVKVSATALKLSVSEIEARGDAIKKMVESLFTFKPVDAHGSLLSGCEVEKLHAPFVDSTLDLIDYALTLSPQEILERADVLKSHEPLLTNSFTYRPEIIESLFKQKPDEVARRAAIMTSLNMKPGKPRYRYDEVSLELLEASKIEIDVLERNAQLLTGQLIPYLETTKTKLFSRNRVTLSPSYTPPLFPRDTTTSFPRDRTTSFSRDRTTPLSRNLFSSNFLLRFSRMSTATRMSFEISRMFTATRMSSEISTTSRHFRAPITPRLNFLKQIPEDNASRLAAIQENWETLSKVFQSQLTEALIVALESVPPDEIASRTAALFHYQASLPSMEKVKVDLFQWRSAEEIYAIAKIQQPSLEPLLISAKPSADQEKDDLTVSTPAPVLVASSNQSEEVASSAPIAKRDVSDVSLLSSVYGEDLGLLLCGVWNFSTSMVDKETLGKIRKVYEGTSSKEFNARAATIKRIFPPSIFGAASSMDEDREHHFFDLVKVSATALELPVSEIEARGDAINKMLESLFSHQMDQRGESLSNHQMDQGGESLSSHQMNQGVESLSSHQMNQGVESLFNRPRKRVVLRTFKARTSSFNFKFKDEGVDLIDYALTLSPQETLDRAAVIKKNETFLKDRLAYRPEIIQSLFKQKPDEIERRVAIMQLLGVYISPEENVEIPKIEIDVLERNAQLAMVHLVPFIETTKLFPGLALDYIPAGAYRVNFLKNRPEDNASRLVAIQQNWDILSKVIPSQDQTKALSAALHWVPSNEIASRAAALFRYQAFLPSTMEAKVNLFERRSADEIEAIAKSQRSALKELSPSVEASAPSGSSQ